MRGRLITAVLVAGVGAALLPSGAMAAAKPAEYKITITNLSKAKFTSPVWGVHDNRATLFQRDRFASPGIALLAEDGDPSMAQAEFQRKKGVRTSATANEVAPGATITIRVRTTSHRLFSFAAMQVCSNDTFAGVSKYRLPSGTKRAVVNIRAYDAGSEANTESAADVPCLGAHGVGPSERKKISVDSRILGIADLDNSRQGWGKNIARMTVKRVK